MSFSIHSQRCMQVVEERASELPPSSLLSVDGLIKLRMQRVFIGALCRQRSSCNHAITERERERDAIFGRDSYERKLSNHHDQGHRQGATAITEFFSVTHTSKNFEGARGAWHNDTMASPSLTRIFGQNPRTDSEAKF